MQILDGKLVAENIKTKIKETLELYAHQNRRTPCLATILIGENGASLSYVASKHKTALSLGFTTKDFKLKDTVSEDEVINLINTLNHDSEVDAILLQLPLPKGYNTEKILNEISPDKDADGITYINMAKVALGENGIVPCTPKGILEILSFYGIQTEGKHAVVIGRSRIVGRPMSLLLNNTRYNATVTCANRHTKDLKKITSDADILIVAVGQSELIDSSYIKEGAVIIDVGINRIKDENAKKGYVIKGDVNFNDVINKASFVTPVPGGVGPLTIACLMENTLELYNQRENIQ